MFIPVTAVETFWLVRRNWCTARKAAAFSLATNGIGMAISSAVIFAAMLVTFMLVMGSDGMGSDTPNSVYIFILLLAIVLPLLLLTGLKIVFLRMLKIRAGRETVVYGSAASAGLIFAVLVVPTVLIYFLS